MGFQLMKRYRMRARNGGNLHESAKYDPYGV